jgi:hypothetical protein
MKTSDESGLMESEVKEILIKLQKHALKKFEANRRYTKDGIAVLSLKIIGNNNNLHPVSFYIKFFRSTGHFLVFF